MMRRGADMDRPPLPASVRGEGRGSRGGSGDVPPTYSPDLSELQTNNPPKTTTRQKTTNAMLFTAALGS